MNALGPVQNLRPGKELQPDHQDLPVPDVHRGVGVRTAGTVRSAPIGHVARTGQPHAGAQHRSQRTCAERVAPGPQWIQVRVVATEAETAPLHPVVIAGHHLPVDAGRVQTAPGLGRDHGLSAIHGIGAVHAVAHADGRLDAERHSVHRQVPVPDNPFHQIVVAGGCIGTNGSGGHVLRIGHYHNTPCSRRPGLGSLPGPETYGAGRGQHEPTARESISTVPFSHKHARNPTLLPYRPGGVRPYRSGNCSPPAVLPKAWISGWNPVGGLCEGSGYPATRGRRGEDEVYGCPRTLRG